MTETGTAVVCWPPRPPRRVAGIPAGLLVCWQVALLLALIAIGQPAGHVIGFGIGAAVVIAATGTRPRGRWAHEWAVLWVRYLLRGARAAPSHQSAAELALLDLAIGVAAVSELEIEQQQVAVVMHAGGGTAVLELETTEPAAALARVPLTVAPGHQPDAPAVSVQLILHTTPALPSGAVPGRAWLAVQVRRDAGYTDQELRAALVSAVRRLRRRLRSEGVAGQPLDQRRLREALHTLTRLDLAGPAAAPGPDPVGTEQWRRWWTRSVPQECLAVRSWPGAPAPPEHALLDALAHADAPQTTAVAARRLRLPVSHGALRAGDEVLAVELMVRLAGRDRSELAAAAGRLGQRLTAAGAVVERLDGRQLPGLAATLPVGGFLPGYAPSPAGGFSPPSRTVTPTASLPSATFASRSDDSSLDRSDATRPQPTATAPAAVPVPAPVAPASVPAPAPVLAPVASAAPTSPAPTSPAPPSPPEPEAEPVEVPTAPVRLSVPAPVQLTPARGQASVTARGHAPAPAGGPHPPTADMPTALLGAAAPPPPPDPATHGAVRAYGASLFTAESPHRSYVERLVTLTRTPHQAPQLVSVLAGEPGLGASTTAAGLARTLATVRDDYTALLSIDTGPVGNSKLLAVCREHAFTVVDLGAHTGEETPQALALSTRIVVVASADRHATPLTKLTLDRIHRVNPALVASAVIVVVCRNTRQYRRVIRELSSDATPQAGQIIAIPPDPALSTVEDVNLARLRGPTREAYLRLAATLACPQPVGAGAGPHAAGPPPYNPSLHP